MILLKNRISLVMLWVSQLCTRRQRKQNLPVFWKWNLLPWIAFEVWVWFVDQLIVLKQKYRWYTLKNWVWWLQKKKWLYWWQRQWCWRWTWRFWLKLLQYTWGWEVFSDILSGIVSFFLYMDLLYSWSYMPLTELPRKHAFWLLAQVKSCKMSAIFNPDSAGLW